MSTREEREAEVEGLITRALDPGDPYDGHDGHDRSPEALEYARVHDPDGYARTMAKIARGE